MSGLMGSLMAKGKTIGSYLGSDMYGVYSSTGKKIKPLIIQILVSRLTVFVATDIVLMSKRMKSYLGAKEKIVVIPEGISLEKFYPKDRKFACTYLNWNKDSFILIFFHKGTFMANGQELQHPSPGNLGFIAWLRGKHSHVGNSQPYMGEYAYRYNRIFMKEEIFDKLLNRMVNGTLNRYKQIVA